MKPGVSGSGSDFYKHEKHRTYLMLHSCLSSFFSINSYMWPRARRYHLAKGEKDRCAH